MAIFHLSVKAVSRSSGRSATGAAAYRSAEKIVDARTGEIHDYARKRGVGITGIVTPAGSTWTPTRAELWNAAELAEKRKDACVAREHEIALPKELTDQQRLALVKGYAKNLADRHGCAVDFAIHHPHRGRDGETNENWHAHILCTTRQVEGLGLGQKCQREKAGQNRAADLDLERAVWASVANAALEATGHAERIDHRSLKAQGIDREPTRHKGPTVTAMERRGVDTEVGQRLAAAAAEGERERAEARALDKQIIDTSRSLEYALGERDVRDSLRRIEAQKERAIAPQPAPAQARQRIITSPSEPLPPAKPQDFASKFASKAMEEWKARRSDPKRIAEDKLVAEHERQFGRMGRMQRAQFLQEHYAQEAAAAEAAAKAAAAAVKKETPKESAQRLVREMHQREAEKAADKIIAERGLAPTPEQRAELVKFVASEQEAQRQAKANQRGISKGGGICD